MGKEMVLATLCQPLTLPKALPYCMPLMAEPSVWLVAVTPPVTVGSGVLSKGHIILAVALALVRLPDTYW